MLCSDHVRQKKRGTILLFSDLKKKINCNLKCINAPNKTNLLSVKQPIQVTVSDKSKEKMKKILKNISDNESSNNESSDNETSDSSDSSDNESSDNESSDNESSDNVKTNLCKPKVNLVVKTLGKDNKSVKPFAIKITPEIKKN